MLKTGVSTINLPGTTDGPKGPFYKANQPVQITLFLETAGPVAIGIQDNTLFPLGSKGRLLPFNQPVQFKLDTGQFVYIASDTPQRVAFHVEDIPYVGFLQAGLDLLKAGMTLATSLLPKSAASAAAAKKKGGC